MEVNAAPKGGYVAAFPSDGFAAVDTFTIQSLDWTDDVDDLPLLYSFMYEVRVRDPTRGKVARIEDLPPLFCANRGKEERPTFPCSLCRLCVRQLYVEKGGACTCCQRVIPTNKPLFSWKAISRTCRVQ